MTAESLFNKYQGMRASVEGVIGGVVCGFNFYTGDLIVACDYPDNHAIGCARLEEEADIVEEAFQFWPNGYVYASEDDVIEN